MAYFPPIIEFIDARVFAHFGERRDLRMLELGNQIILNEFWGRRYRPPISARSGKAYYEDLGYAHASIDLNGEDGALTVDLSQSLEDDGSLGTFDFITNAGTTEHVEPLAGQYNCFKTIHDLCRPGGLMFHFVPGIEDLAGPGYWKYHSNNYYSGEFFRSLAKENGYQLLELGQIESLLAVCLLRETDQPFMGDRARFCSRIHRRAGGLVYEGVNDGSLSWLSRISAKWFDYLRSRHDHRVTMENLRARGHGEPRA